MRTQAIRSATRVTYDRGLMSDEGVDVEIGTETDAQLEWVVATRMGLTADFRGYDPTNMRLVHQDLETGELAPLPMYTEDIQAAVEVQIGLGYALEPDDSGPTRVWKAHRKGAPLSEAVSENPARAIAMAVAREGQDQFIRVPRAMATQEQIEAAEQRLNLPPEYPRQR